MEAVRLHDVGDLRFEIVDAPSQPLANEVTVAVSFAGICGSDLHNFRTGAWITRTPSIAGHEFTGTITATGPGVDGLPIGQEVIVDSRHVCGRCAACREGLGHVCESLGFLGEAIDGGFAEAVTLPERNIIAAPAGVAARHLAMAEPLAVALHALRRLAAPADAEIAVTGCGAIGGLVGLLASRGGHPVRLVDRNGDRAALVAEATGGTISSLDDLPSLRCRHVVETTGSEAVIAKLVENAPGCASIALVGIGHASRIVDPVMLVEREISLLGCHAFTDADLRDIGEMLPGLAPHLDAFIAEEIPLSAVPDAYARHATGKVSGLKTLIDCRKS